MDNYDDLMQQLYGLNRQPNWGAPNSLGLFDNSFAGEPNMMAQNFYYPQMNRGGIGQVNQGGSMIDQMSQSQPAQQPAPSAQVPKAEQIGQQPEPRYANPAVDSNENNIRARKKALNDPNAPEDNPYAVGLR